MNLYIPYILSISDTTSIVILSDGNAIKVIEKSSHNKLFDLFSYDTVFTVGVTITIFLYGIIIDRLIKYYDVKKERKELRKYFRTYLYKITDKTCNNLASMYKTAYQEINIDKGIYTSAPKILTGDFERINNINDKELFLSIKEKSSLSILLSNLDFVEKLIIEIDMFHDKIRRENDEIRAELQNMINIYFDRVENYLEHVRTTQPEYPNRDDFYKLLSNSILKYHSDIVKSNSLTRLYREIIRPVQDQVVETYIFRIDPVAFKIADLGKKISYQYNYLRRLTAEARIKYRQFYQYVNESQQRLREEREKVSW